MKCKVIILKGGGIPLKFATTYPENPAEGVEAEIPAKKLEQFKEINRQYMNMQTFLHNLYFAPEPEENT